MTIAASVVGFSPEEINVKMDVPALPSASNTELADNVKTPLRFSLLCTCTAGGPAVLVTVILLKSVTELPLILWVEDPLNTTVPDPLLNVPLLLKLPATFKVVGAFSVPVIEIPEKLEADDPAMDVVPLKTMVPLLCVKVPLLVKVPATFMEPEDAVNVPLMVTLLNELALEPDTVVVPPKVTVPLPALRVPLFTRFPLTL